MRSCRRTMGEREGRAAVNATAYPRPRVAKRTRLRLPRPDGTNYASERGISKIKVRYKCMRGYKSDWGMKNGIALTQ